ncbi:MAG: family efflux transporter [Lachnospiraceae bacterium]|jgi:putative MATE family efflux protein|nr:family efflux transporter [Lachnospiraceae bacterium]
MEYVNPLGEEKVYKLLLKFSLPAIVGMLVNSIYNIVDRIYIGNSSELGANGIAGITIGFPIMIILMALGILFGVGGSTLFSMKLGEKKIEDAETALGNAFVLLLIAGFLFMILGQIFLEPILLAFGASKTVLPYSIEYMRVIFFGAIFQVVSMGLNSFMRADGNPKLAMWTMFLGAGTNIVLDPIFIYVFHMGMAGAALATIISQAFSFIWVISYFIGKHSKMKLKLSRMKLRFEYIARITSLGLPGFALQVASSFLNAVLNNNLYLYGGDIAVSGMGVVNSLQALLIMPVIGLNQGVQPIISFNYGAKKYDRVKTAVKLAMSVATGIVILGFIITRLFPNQMIQLFNDNAKLVEFGVQALSIWFLMLPLIGFQIIAANFFQAIGRSKSAMFLTLTRQVIILIPSIIIFPRIWGLTGILYAGPFSDILASLLTGTWFYFGIRRLDLTAPKNEPVDHIKLVTQEFEK